MSAKGIRFAGDNGPYTLFPILRNEAGSLIMGGYYNIADIREGRLSVPELTPDEIEELTEKAGAAGYTVENWSI